MSGGEQQVWKFTVHHGPDATVRLPFGAQILDVACQGSGVFLWALVDPEEFAATDRRIAYFATCEPIPAGWKHLGTAHGSASGLPYVWHVFEKVLF